MRAVILLMKNVFIISFILLSSLCIQAQTVTKEQIREESLPEGELRRLHVSGNNGATAALLQRADGYWVYINQTLYGPFDDVDLLQSTPFIDSGAQWQFRASQGGRQILIVNGNRYGPFDSIWTPNFSKSGLHWGTVIKDAEQYAVIVDGNQSGPFDWIYTTANLESTPPTDTSTPTSAPQFYGSHERWVAIGYRNEDLANHRASEFRVLAAAGEGEAYDKVFGYPTTAELGSLPETAFLTADGESFVIDVHKTGLPEEDKHLWINNQTYGPYRGFLDISYFATKQMTRDGSDWIINGADQVYTRNRTFPYQGSVPTISANGRSLAFAFKRGDLWYQYINGSELGPFLNTSYALLSSSGARWHFATDSDDHLSRIITESGVYGPYGSITQRFYRGEDWIGIVTDPNGSLNVISNGITIAGPYQMVRPGPNTLQTSAWYLTAIQGDRLSLIIDGQTRFQQAGMRPALSTNVAVSKDGNHWAMVALEADGTSSFIDDGRIVKGIRPRSIRILRSETGHNYGLVYTNGTHYYLVIDGQTYGGVVSPISVVLSTLGQAWVAAGPDIDGTKLILPGATPANYDEVAELKSVNGEDAVISNSLRDNLWSPRVNAVVLGSYPQASINCRTDGSRAIFLATNEGDRNLKIYKVQIQR